jgi:peroxiredoxin
MQSDRPTDKPVVPLQPGTPAPAFTLPVSKDEQVSLSDYRGQPVVLVFYPADWSPVCGAQVTLYNEVLPEFKRLGAAMLGISIDHIWSHQAFAEQNNIHFPLLADFEPKGSVARDYGVYRPQDGTSERALFVLDSKGIIHWSHVSPGGVDSPNPGADGILTALEDLSNGGKVSRQQE